MGFKVQRQQMQEPAGLLSTLRGIAPDFGDPEFLGDVETGEANLHTVWTEFGSYFLPEAWEPAKLSRLATLVHECVAVQDNLENATGTCFLEHLRQRDRRGVFRRYLSPEVKDYMRIYC